MVADCQLSIECVDSLAGLQALEPVWCALERASQTPFPFLTHAWAMSWWKHLAKRKLHVRDSISVRVLRTPAGEVVAIAPLMCTERPPFGPLRTRQLQFLGRDDGDITELRGMLCLPEFEADAYRALLAELQRSAASWDWMLWHRLRKASTGERQVTACGGECVAHVPNYVLPLAASWTDLHAGLPRNIKESLRKCYNSLKRDGLTPTLQVVEEPSAIRSALSHFFRLHGARASMSSGKFHRNAFDTDAKRSFLSEVCERLAVQGKTRIFLLKLGERVVATRIGFVINGSIYLYYSGYDPEFAKYSVMTTTVAEALKHAISLGLRSANLSSGNDVSKTRWAPREDLYCEVV
ncbi:MAG TPA: GNAT family N-acetyltransferase, partial [Polyangiales bacterium]